MNKILTGFISGAVCCATAFYLAPMFWWLGAIAGFIAGYVAYDFRQVLTAVPVAFKATGAGSIWLVTAPARGVRKARQWLAEPHPFVLPAFFLVVIASPFLIPPSLISMVSEGVAEGWYLGIMSALLCLELLVIAGLIATMVTAAPIAILAFIGCRSERGFWWPFVAEKDKQLDSSIVRKAELEAEGYQQMPITYGNVGRWVVKGIGQVIFFLVWTWWTALIVGISKFAVTLAVLTYSHKRVFYPLTGTLGGVIGYFATRHLATTTGAQFFAIVCSGIIGAALVYAFDLMIARRPTRIEK